MAAIDVRAVCIHAHNAWRDMFVESIRSIRSRVRYAHLEKSLSMSRVRRMFEKYDRTSDSDMVAARSRCYRPLMTYVYRTLQAHQETRTLRVLDLGCGTGVLLSQLTERLSYEFKYVGYDIDRRLISTLSGMNHRENVFFTSKLPREEFDFVIAVNSLCYMNAEELSKTLAAPFMAECHLIIIEPVPSWFWESRFADIQLALRMPGQLIKVASGYGFSIVESPMLSYVGRLGNRYFLPVAWAAHLSSMSRNR